MSKAQELGQKIEKFQGQTLDTARKAQDIVVEAVTAWSVIANAVPGYAKLTKQFPVTTEIIDSNFDFAQQILTSQREFAGRLAGGTAPKATAPAAPQTAPKAIASAPAKKSAPRKVTPAAKKPATVQASAAATVTQK